RGLGRRVVAIASRFDGPQTRVRLPEVGIGDVDLGAKEPGGERAVQLEDFSGLEVELDRIQELEKPGGLERQRLVSLEEEGFASRHLKAEGRRGQTVPGRQPR